MSSHFKLHDRVIYTTDKYTSCPGPRAKNVVAAANGESYVYQVDKYWVVTEILANGDVVLMTRRGKKHVVTAGDRRLRKANLLERFLKARQFPAEPAQQPLMSATAK